MFSVCRPWAQSPGGKDGMIKGFIPDAVASGPGRGSGGFAPAPPLIKNLKLTATANFVPISHGGEGGLRAAVKYSCGRVKYRCAM